jgi:hypothetical protein
MEAIIDWYVSVMVGFIKLLQKVGLDYLYINLIYFWKMVFFDHDFTVAFWSNIFSGVIIGGLITKLISSSVGKEICHYEINLQQRINQAKKTKGIIKDLKDIRLDIRGSVENLQTVMALIRKNKLIIPVAKEFIKKEWVDKSRTISNEEIKDQSLLNQILQYTSKFNDRYNSIIVSFEYCGDQIINLGEGKERHIQLLSEVINAGNETLSSLNVYIETLEDEVRKLNIPFSLL